MTRTDGNDNDGGLWSVRRTAQHLDCSIWWIYNQARQQGLHGFKVGRALRFRPADVEAWLERNRSTGEPVSAATVG